MQHSLQPLSRRPALLWPLFRGVLVLLLLATLSGCSPSTSESRRGPKWMILGRFATTMPDGSQETLTFDRTGSAEWLITTPDGRTQVYDLLFQLETDPEPHELDLFGFDRGPLFGKHLYGILEFDDRLEFKLDVRAGLPGQGSELRPRTFGPGTRIFRRV